MERERVRFLTNLLTCHSLTDSMCEMQEYNVALMCENSQSTHTEYRVLTEQRGWCEGGASLETLDRQTGWNTVRRCRYEIGYRRVQEAMKYERVLLVHDIFRIYLLSVRWKRGEKENDIVLGRRHKYLYQYILI